MKLRWSNNKNFFISFEANDLESFTNESKSALRLFRAISERRVHRGEIKKTVSWFDFPALHIEDKNGGWMNPGLIKRIDNGFSFFEPRVITIKTFEAENAEKIHVSDNSWIEKNAGTIWTMCCDGWRWMDGLNVATMLVGDEINRITSDSERQ